MDSSSVPDDNEVQKPNENETNQPAPKRKNKRKAPTKSDTNVDDKQDNTQKLLETRSEVWRQFTRLEGNRNKCKCHHCGTILSCLTTSGTSNLRSHLNRCTAYDVWLKSDEYQMIAKAEEGVHLKSAKVSEEVFREAANKMIVLGELPFNFVEGIAFRYFCSMVNLYTPHSRRTATRDIVKLYVQKKDAMKKWFNANKQRVSLTTDIWVAPSTNNSYMVITAHFIDSSWCLKKMIIGFKYVEDHTGDTIQYVLSEVLAEWGIDKLFTVTVDNATANTSALTRFQREFNALGEDALVLNGDYMHVRCAAHIINLVVKDGLLDLTPNVEAIRNGIRYVRKGGKRMKAFRSRVETGKVKRGSLVLDVPTRWNSTFTMLSSAINYKNAFVRMEAEDKLYSDYFVEKNGKKRIGPPLTADFEAIERLVKFLQVCYDATKALSASTSVAAHKCFGEIANINMALKTLGKSLDDELRVKAVAMQEKFEKYWEGISGMNKLLIVANVLDPRKRLVYSKLYFEEQYGKNSDEASSMLDSIMKLLTSLFKEYSSRSQRANKETSSQGVTTTSSQGQDQFGVDEYNSEPGFVSMDSLFDKMVEEEGLREESNELELYLNDKLEKKKSSLPGIEFNVLSWWKCNQFRYPVLAAIAKDVFAMQVSSVASESAFSTSGRVLDPSRSCLSHYTLEALMCTEQWLKCEIKLDAKGFVTNKEILEDIELQDDLEIEFEEQN